MFEQSYLKMNKLFGDPGKSNSITIIVNSNYFLSYMYTPWRYCLAFDWRWFAFLCDSMQQATENCQRDQAFKATGLQSQVAKKPKILIYAIGLVVGLGKSRAVRSCCDVVKVCYCTRTSITVRWNRRKPTTKGAKRKPWKLNGLGLVSFCRSTFAIKCEFWFCKLSISY